MKPDTWLIFGIGFLFGGLTGPLVLYAASWMLARYRICKRCGERWTQCFCLGGPR